MLNTDSTSGRKFLGVKEIQSMFNIGREKAIALIKSEGFPVIKIGRTYRIDSDQLEVWIKEHEGKAIDIEKRKDTHDEF